MTATAPIFIIFNDNFVTNVCTDFHNSPTDGSVANNRSLMDGKTDRQAGERTTEVASTTGVSLLRKERLINGN
jgi:hypothetical protein